MTYHTTQAKFVLLLTLVLGMTLGGFAAEGDLDPTFDGDGILFTGSGSSVTDIAVQQDGKIVASTSNAVIVRYNSDGSIDSSFGISGKVTLPSVSSIKLALQSNGKIVVVASSNADIFVARLNSDGSFDTTFNGTGTVTYDLRGTGDSARAVSIQTDGKIVVGCRSTRPSNTSNNDFAVARLTANGSLDTTFGSGGIVFTTFQDTDLLNDLAIQTDGKILATGESFLIDPDNNNPNGSFATVRYSSDGSIDSSFTGDGTDLTVFDIGVLSGVRRSHKPSKVLLREGGKILVVGSSSSTTVSFVTMIQYNSDGSVDTSFGNQGKVKAGLFEFSETFANDAAIQSDNKIVVSGEHRANVKSAKNAIIGRFNADGTLDNTFDENGWNGIASPDFTSETSGANAIAIQPNGKTLIGGAVRISGQTRSFIARYITTDCQTNCPIPGSNNVFDFDGDGRTDASIFRNDTWYLQRSSANNTNIYRTVTLGQLNDKLVPADYDGDGKTDVAVWRENVSGNQSFFYIMLSATNTLFTYQFGNTGDDPRAVSDWDGDGKADLTVYRQAANAGEQSLYYYIPSTAETPFFVVIPWGTAGDETLRGDFDGDGKADAAVFRPSNGVWYILQSSNSEPLYVNWGIATDKLTTGEFNGDNRSDFVAYRDGVWYVLYSSNFQVRYEYWGISTDSVVAGDYDGDGLTDFAVWRDGVYYILNNSNSQVTYQQFGMTGDIPVASAFNR